MPMFFFAGESTHGGEPFLGIDPTLMSTQLYHKLEMNTDFCQQSLGETTPPPVCLKMQDLKGTYSASDPAVCSGLLFVHYRAAGSGMR